MVKGESKQTKIIDQKNAGLFWYPFCEATIFFHPVKEINGNRKHLNFWRPTCGTVAQLRAGDVNVSGSIWAMVTRS